jgi:methylmalonyl-CoA mutase cobalamin-binding subunit
MKAHFQGLAGHEIRAKKARDILASKTFESITHTANDKKSEKITKAVESSSPQIKRKRLGQIEEF